VAAGLDTRRVASQQVYNGCTIAFIAGMAVCVAILSACGPAALACATVWMVGIALLMVVVGLVTHYGYFFIYSGPCRKMRRTQGKSFVFTLCFKSTSVVCMKWHVQSFA